MGILEAHHITCKIAVFVATSTNSSEEENTTYIRKKPLIFSRMVSHGYNEH
jgi:hypothetical protein